MINLIISLLIIVMIVVFITSTLIRRREFTIYNLGIYIALAITWVAMFIFKNTPNLKTHGIFMREWWTWPIMLSLYQFTQAAARLPLGILSQKLRSRKDIVMLVMLVMLVGLILILSSNFSDWSIVIAVIASGFVGASFGLDSQYWSENWNIKKGFWSSIIIFTLPVIGYAFSNVVNFAFEQKALSATSISIISISILTANIIGYFFFKERKETIFIDNMDPNSKPLANKDKYDILSLVVANAVIVGAYTFVMTFTIEAMLEDAWQVTVILISSFIGSALISWMITKNIFSPTLVIHASKAFIVVCGLTLGLFAILDLQNNVVWEILMSLSSFAFGVFFLSMFGTALHFDHKYPALVMGIFLSVKSFAMGVAILVATLCARSSGISLMYVGILIISISIGGYFFNLFFHYYLYNKKLKRNLDTTIIDAVKFEEISN